MGDRTEDCPGSPSRQKEIHTSFQSGKLDEHVRNDIATKSGVDIRRREASWEASTDINSRKSIVIRATSQIDPVSQIVESQQHLGHLEPHPYPRSFQICRFLKVIRSQFYHNVDLFENCRTNSLNMSHTRISIFVISKIKYVAKITNTGGEKHLNFWNWRDAEEFQVDKCRQAFSECSFHCYYRVGI